MHIGTFQFALLQSVAAVACLQRSNSQPSSWYRGPTNRQLAALDSGLVQPSTRSLRSLKREDGTIGDVQVVWCDGVRRGGIS